MIVKVNHYHHHDQGKKGEKQLLFAERKGMAPAGVLKARNLRWSPSPRLGLTETRPLKDERSVFQLSFPHPTSEHNDLICTAYSITIG